MDGDGKKSPGDDWAGASIDELRSWRSDALRHLEKAEQAAAEARRQSKMYAKSAEKLENKAFEAEAQAKASEAKGDVEEAESFRDGCTELRNQAQRNYQTADTSGRLAMERDREAYHHKTLALRLEAQIKKIMTPPQDRED